MAFKDILLVLITYPKATDASEIQEAVALAVALDARISAIACVVQVRAPSQHLGEGFVADLVASERKKSSEVAAELLAAFQASAKKAGVSGEPYGDVFHVRRSRFASPRSTIEGSDNRPRDFSRPQLSVVC